MTPKALNIFVFFAGLLAGIILTCFSPTSSYRPACLWLAGFMCATAVGRRARGFPPSHYPTGSPKNQIGRAGEPSADPVLSALSIIERNLRCLD